MKLSPRCARQSRFSLPATAYAVIGMIYGKHGRADEALEALNSAEKADPNFDMTYVYRGNVFASRGQMAEAASEYRRALAINANNTAAQQGLTMAQTPPLDENRRQCAVPDSGRSRRHGDLPPQSASGAGADRSRSTSTSCLQIGRPVRIWFRASFMRRCRCER